MASHTTHTPLGVLQEAGKNLAVLIRRNVEVVMGGEWLVGEQALRMFHFTNVGQKCWRKEREEGESHELVSRGN